MRLDFRFWISLLPPHLTRYLSIYLGKWRGTDYVLFAVNLHLVDSMAVQLTYLLFWILGVPVWRLPFCIISHPSLFHRPFTLGLFTPTAVFHRVAYFDLVGLAWRFVLFFIYIHIHHIQ